MPAFRLNTEISFPPVQLAEENGLLAIGGDLSPQRLLFAYSHGIFPWYNEGDPILWWSPATRCVLLRGDFHLSRSLNKLVRSEKYYVTIDQSFTAVIRACAISGERKIHGTWLGEEMIRAYEKLFLLGVCHSVEVWEEEELVGGLYGVSIGRCFFGESMFHIRSDASKIALFALSQALFLNKFIMIDMQMPTPHLLSLGGRLLGRETFDLMLKDALSSNQEMNSPWPGDRTEGGVLA